MALAPGARLGPYEILSAIGAGGMGEVYRACDTRLNRPVAIKVLAASLAADPQLRERFDREARAISALNHPHICTLYDVGHQDGVDFLVLEYLEGETLADRMARSKERPLPPDEALRYAIQIADALDKAHRSGIVHRDLKPANVFLVRSAGASAPPLAKLLDFGLAKSAAPVIATSGLSMLPTTPPTLTAQGTILGTFQYMAPEQIEGLEADARTDIFAFGAVLFEMLTGRPVFEGKTRAQLLGAILKDEPPPISTVKAAVTNSLDRIVRTCLAKDPDDRWQSARDLLRELKWVADGPRDTQGEIHPSTARTASLRVAIATSVVTAAIVGGGVWALMRQPPVVRPVIRFLATPPETAPLSIEGASPDLALSPDGTRLVYVGASGQSNALLYLRQLTQSEATPLVGSVGRGPFFSPDGEWIGFFAGADLAKVSAHGGPPVTICTGCAQANRGASWGPDDTIVFGRAGGTGLARVSVAGGDPVALTSAQRNDQRAHLWPEFLPGGRALLFTIQSTGTIDNALIAVLDLKTGEQKILVHGGAQAHYLPTGHLAYGVAGTIRVVGFDLSRRAVIGNPVPVLENVLMKQTGAADFSVSQDGSLAYIAGDGQNAGMGQRLAWIDRQGHEEAISAPPRNYVQPRLSPDGHRVALDVRDQQNDIWIWSFPRGPLTRLTTDPAADQYPVWTPDGRRLAFASQRMGASNVFWQAADGTGAAERLTTSQQIQYPYAFTPDARMMVLRDTGGSTLPSDISLMALDGDRMAKPLIHTSFNESNAELSPDGRWLAYQSDESSIVEIHVRPFPNVDGGHWQVSTNGGARPVWARSGRELFYVDPQGHIMAVPVQTGATFSFRSPSSVAGPVQNLGGGTAGRNYDVSADGKRFLVLRSAARTDDKANPPQLNVVLNWLEELKARVPTK